MKFKLKFNYGLSLYMLSTNWARVCWGITPVAPFTNIKIIGLPGTAVHPILGINMSYANSAATNQIHVCSCIFIDVILVIIIYN